MKSMLVGDKDKRSIAKFALLDTKSRPTLLDILSLVFSLSKVKPNKSPEGFSYKTTGYLLNKQIK